MGIFFIDLIKVFLGRNGEIWRNKIFRKIMEIIKERNSFFVFINILGDKV